MWGLLTGSPRCRWRKSTSSAGRKRRSGPAGTTTCPWIPMARASTNRSRVSLRGRDRRRHRRQPGDGEGADADGRPGRRIPVSRWKPFPGVRGASGMALTMRGYLRGGRDRRDPGGCIVSRRRERRRQDARTADRIAMALALLRQSDERRHGLAVAQRHGPRPRSARQVGGAGRPATEFLASPTRRRPLPLPLLRV
jgi:hypothetical protein